MHRNDLLNLLRDYRTRYPLEEDAINKLEDFVKSNSDCFERTLLIGHLTASAFLLNKDGSKVLLTHHKKLDRWLQLGGHADGCSDIKAVALKEAEEESGLSDLEFVFPGIFDLDIHEIPARKDEPEHKHYDLRFLLRCTESEDFRVSEESNRLAWIHRDTFLDLIDEESLLRMHSKWTAWAKTKLSS